jgi:pilus assembly protein CpaB
VKNKGKMLIGFFCILFTVLFAFVIVPMGTGMIGKTTTIVRVKETIRVGEQLNERNVEEVEVNGYNLPATIVKNKAEVIGNYSTAKLESGDYVMKSKLVNDMITSGNYMSALDGEKQIVSVAIKDFANGISGKLMPGDIVMILNNASVANSKSTTYSELQYVKVLAVTTQNGVDMGGEKVSDNTELPATVTLLVNKVQAQIVTGLDKNGNISFALMYRGDEDTANQFLQKQDDFFKTNDV